MIGLKQWQQLKRQIELRDAKIENEKEMIYATVAAFCKNGE